MCRPPTLADRRDGSGLALQPFAEVQRPCRRHVALPIEYGRQYRRYPPDRQLRGTDTDANIDAKLDSYPTNTIFEDGADLYL